MNPRYCLHGLLGIVACFGTATVVGLEEALSIYASGGLNAAFSITQLNPFEPKQRWGSYPLRSYAEVLDRTAFIYRHYRKALGFSEKEIENLQTMDSTANPAMFAYITSRQARSENFRGVLRIASVGALPSYFKSFITRPTSGLLPMEQKYEGIGAHTAARYPKRVEIGRFASDDTNPLRRLDTLTRLLRASSLFLHEEMHDATIVIESTETTRELYTQYGFCVDPEAPMPEGRVLMHVAVRDLPTFARFCADLLTKAGDTETAAKMIWRAETLEQE